MSIYRVDDGSIWHFDAKDRFDAKEKWLEACKEQGYDSYEQVIEDFGEPTIKLIQLEEAARIKVRMDDEVDNCPHCNGTGKVTACRSLLEVWQHEQQLAPDKKAHLGILCNSEY